MLKATVAKYNAEELLSKRSQISLEIRKELEIRASTFGLELVDVAITHLVFGKEFAMAIEAKQVAQQEAERQQWVVEKADKEREAAVIRAEGEAEAAQIVNQALTESGPGLIEVGGFSCCCSIRRAWQASRPRRRECWRGRWERQAATRARVGITRVYLLLGAPHRHGQRNRPVALQEPQRHLPAVWRAERSTWLEPIPVSRPSKGLPRENRGFFATDSAAKKIHANPAYGPVLSIPQSSQVKKLRINFNV